jgi:hypothetical protein
MIFICGVGLVIGGEEERRKGGNVEMRRRGRELEEG